MRKNIQQDSTDSTLTPKQIEVIEALASGASAEAPTLERFPRGLPIGPGGTRSISFGQTPRHGSKEGQLRPLGFSREAPMAPSLARGSTLHCKRD